MKLPTAKKPRETDVSKYKFMIYGEPGAGKSTLASKFPDAIFIPTEPGLNYLEVFTITDDEGNPKVIKNWTEFTNAVRMLCTVKHQFKTVIIDTVDNALEFCAIHTIASRGIEHESDEGFGKGWGMVTREFKKVVNHLANSGFGIVFISHEKTSEKETKGIKRQVTSTSLSGQGNKFINGLVDFVFYCYQDNDHQRMMKTKATLNLNAKDRTGHLPPTMPIDYDNLILELESAFKKQEAQDSGTQPDLGEPPNGSSEPEQRPIQTKRPPKNYAPGAR